MALSVGLPVALKLSSPALLHKTAHDEAADATRSAGPTPTYAPRAGATHRLYVAKFGPFGLAMLMLIIGFAAAVILLAVVGAILVWIPILALLVSAGVIYRLLRR